MDHEEAVELARGIVQRRCRQAGFPPASCEDLLQDVLVKYLQAWPDGAAPENPAAWIETTTRNAIIDAARAAGRRPVERFDGSGDDPIELAVAALRANRGTSQGALARDVLGRTFALVEQADADLLRARYLEGYSAAALAERHGTTAANIDQRTTRAKRKLREALTGRPDLVVELRRAHPSLY